MASTNDNGLASREGQPAKELTKSTRNFSSRSTAKEAQIRRLLECVAIRPHHTHDLEKRGYQFDVARITTVDSDGFTHRGVALYGLASTPEGRVLA